MTEKGKCPEAMLLLNKIMTIVFEPFDCGDNKVAAWHESFTRCEKIKKLLKNGNDDVLSDKIIVFYPTCDGKKIMKVLPLDEKEEIEQLQHFNGELSKTIEEMRDDTKRLIADKKQLQSQLIRNSCRYLKYKKENEQLSKRCAAKDDEITRLNKQLATTNERNDTIKRIIALESHTHQTGVGGMPQTGPPILEKATPPPNAPTFQDVTNPSGLERSSPRGPGDGKGGSTPNAVGPHDVKFLNQIENMEPREIVDDIGHMKRVGDALTEPREDGNNSNTEEKDGR